MKYTIPKPAYNTPRRRITELRRVPNAIPFARYSTRLHRATRRALAVDTVCKWKRKWKASTHFRTDVKAHAHCPPLPPPPSLLLSFLLSFLPYSPEPSTSPSSPIVLRAPSQAQTETEAQRQRERETSNWDLNNVILAVGQCHTRATRWNAISLHERRARTRRQTTCYEIYRFVTNGIFRRRGTWLSAIVKRLGSCDLPNFANVRRDTVTHFAGTFADAQLWIEIKVPTVGNGLRDTNIINLDSLVIFITVYTMRSGLINDQLVFLSRRLTRYVTRKSTISQSWSKWWTIVSRIFFFFLSASHEDVDLDLLEKWFQKSKNNVVRSLEGTRQGIRKFLKYRVCQNLNLLFRNECKYSIIHFL